MLKPDEPVAVIEKLVDSLTESPNLELNVEVMKRIKGICRSNAENVPHVYYSLFTQLRKEHAEVRYIVLLAINDLFLRSQAFRKLLEENFEEFLELTMETDPEKSLPPPKTVAERLKLKTRHYIKEWYSQFGRKHKIIKHAYSFLRSCKNVNFDEIDQQSVRASYSASLRERIVATEISKMKKEMENTAGEIISVGKQIENCFQLLLPLPDDLFNETDAMPVEDHNDATEKSARKAVDDMCNAVSLREHGIRDIKTNLSIEIDNFSAVTVEENKDTSPVLENLNDLYAKITKTYLPSVIKWLKVFSKGKKSDDLIKKAIDLKGLLESKVSKYKELKLSHPVGQIESKRENEDSDDDLEEVPEKEGFEANVPELKSDANSSIPSSSRASGSGSSGTKKSNLPSVSPSTSADAVPEWQDPELLKAIEVATGVDLRMPVKGEKRKAKEKKREKRKLRKVSARTDLKAQADTGYNRLHKKVFKHRR